MDAFKLGDRVRLWLGRSQLEHSTGDAGTVAAVMPSAASGGGKRGTKSTWTATRACFTRCSTPANWSWRSRFRSGGQAEAKPASGGRKLDDMEP
jgi:hypothetical protein